MRRWITVRSSLYALIALSALIAAGGVYWWRQGRPEQIYTSARTHFKQGEDALKQKDYPTAQKAFTAADERLQALLAPDKAPAHPQGLMLRYRVLSQLSSLASRTEAAGQASPPGRTSNDLAKKARACAYLVAADADNAEAQAAMLEICFREDQLDLAERYANNLLAQPQAQSPEVDLHPYRMGAHFVLARKALRRSPPEPDLVLEHVRRSDELQQRWADARAAESGARPDTRTRWRMINLQAQALLLKTASVQTSAGAVVVRDPRAEQAARQSFQDSVAGWLERLRGDLKPTGADPEASIITGLSTSELRGLLDFLALAVEQAPDHDGAVERVRLTLEVWAALLAGRPPAPDNLQEVAKRTAALQEVSQRFAHWPRLIEKIPRYVTVQVLDWLTFYPVLEVVGTRLLKAAVSVDPAICLALARLAQKHGHWDAGARFAGLGLRATAARRLPPDHHQILDLHATAAWLCLLQKKTTEVEEHLDVLRKNASHCWGETALVEAVQALEDGDLKQAVAQLQQLRQHPTLRRCAIFHLLQAHTELALGRYDRALPHLQQLEQYFGKSDQVTEDQRTLAQRLALRRRGIELELFRCYLALGHLEQALAYKGRLDGEPEGLTASITLARHYLGLGPTATSQRPLGLAPRSPAFLAAARQELDAALQVAPNEPRLLLVEAEWLARQPGPSAILRADTFLQTAATAPDASAEARLVWITWLLRQGRTKEAGEVLERLPKQPAEAVARPIRLVRNQWLLAQSRPLTDASGLIQLLGLWEEDGITDVYLAGGAVVGRYESDGLKHYWRGQAAQSQGDLEVAARSYGQAMAFSFLRAPARRHLLACLLQLRDKGQPETANDLASDGLKNQSALSLADQPGSGTRAPFDPVLLVAFIETALPLDNIRGNQGIEKALEALAGVFAGQTRDPAAAAFYQARTWLTASRPDLALTALQRALKINAAHLPSLQLARSITQANEDWTFSLRCADALERIQPTWPDVALWRAEALSHLGETAQARTLYRSFVEQHPDRPEGYQGLVGLLEAAKDDAEALVQVERWRGQLPADLDALQTEVRLLARTGRSGPASTTAERALRSARSEAAAALAVARGFLEASRPTEALAWAKRADEAVKPGTERETRFEARCLLGDACQELARASGEPALRTRYLDQAMNHYRSVFQEAPRHVHACRQLALLQVERGEADAAYAIVQRLRQGRFVAKPVSGDRLGLELLDALGTVYAASGHHQEAVVLFKEAAQGHAREPQVYLHLGHAQIAADQKADAYASLNQAATLAEVKADQAKDAAEKARWLSLAAEARNARPIP